MNGDALFSSEADSYQWYASGELLEGETSQSLLIDPVVGGVFSVEVAIGECFKSSDEFEYIVTGIIENTSFTVYPNPSRESIVIESDVDLSHAFLTLHSQSGQAIQELNNLSGNTSTVSLEHVPAGFYILSIHSSSGVRRVKIIKQN
jgi:hypothetical protein